MGYNMGVEEFKPHVPRGMYVSPVTGKLCPLPPRTQTADPSGINSGTTETLANLIPPQNNQPEPDILPSTGSYLSEAGGMGGISLGSLSSGQTGENIGPSLINPTPVLGQKPSETQPKLGLYDEWKSKVVGDIPLDRFVTLAGMAAQALDPKGFGGRLGQSVAAMGAQAEQGRLGYEERTAVRDQEQANRQQDRDDRLNAAKEMAAEAKRTRTFSHLTSVLNNKSLVSQHAAAWKGVATMFPELNLDPNAPLTDERTAFVKELNENNSMLSKGTISREEYNQNVNMAAITHGQSHETVAGLTKTPEKAPAATEVTLITSNLRNTLGREPAPGEILAEQDRRKTEVAGRVKTPEQMAQEIKIAGTKAEATERGRQEAQKGLVDEKSMESAYQYLKTSGELPPEVGRLFRLPVAQVELINYVSKRQGEEGITGIDRAVNKALYKSETSELMKVAGLHGIASVAQGAAIGHGKTVLELAQKKNETGIPVADRWLRAGKKAIAGDADVTSLDIAFHMFSTETARYLSSMTAGGQLAEGEANKLRALVDGASSTEQIKGGVQTITRLMSEKDKSFVDTKKRVQQELKDRGVTVTAPNSNLPAFDIKLPAGAQTGKYNGAPSYSTDGGKTIYDMTGKRIK